VAGLILAYVPAASSFGQTTKAVKATYDRSGFDPKVICDTLKNSFDCARSVETKLSEIYSDLISRKTDKLLTLKLSSGKQMPFKDSFKTDDDPDVVRYSVIDYLEGLKSYLVEIQYYEGHAYQLVSRSTGLKTSVVGLPVLSPDGKAFVCHSTDVVGEYNPYALQVWKVSGTGFAKVYDLKKMSWCATDVSWLDATKIRIKRARWDENTYNEVPLSSRLLSYTGGTWAIR
jgi:hypothetical protein